MSPVGPNVVVVDDHSLVAGAIATALRGRGITARAVEPARFLGGAVPQAPARGLVLLDPDLGAGLDGAAMVPRLCRAGWRVLLVTGSTDETRVAVAMAAGALGRVRKSAPFEELVAVAGRAAAGHPVTSDGERARLRRVAEVAGGVARRERRRWERLTPRERQVVERIAAGRRPAAIADEFVVSLATVRSHIRAILAKLEVGSQLEVAALARTRREP